MPNFDSSQRNPDVHSYTSHLFTYVIPFSLKFNVAVLFYYSFCFFMLYSLSSFQTSRGLNAKFTLDIVETTAKPIEYVFNQLTGGDTGIICIYFFIWRQRITYINKGE